MSGIRDIILERVRSGGVVGPARVRPRNVIERTFRCPTTRVACDLAHELIELGERVHHRGAVTIDGVEVSVRLFTRGVNEVTTLDEQWIDEAQALFDALSGCR